MQSESFPTSGEGKFQLLGHISVTAYPGELERCRGSEHLQLILQAGAQPPGLPVGGDGGALV